MLIFETTSPHKLVNGISSQNVRWLTAQDPAADGISVNDTLYTSTSLPNQLSVRWRLYTNIHHTHPVLEASSILNTHTHMQL